ncbi:Glycosyl transferase, family 6 [Candidatus Nanopelagicaceae bacterium]
MKTYGVIMVATNNYLELWKLTVASLLSKKVLSGDISIHLLTDQPEAAQLWWNMQSTHAELLIYEIPPYKWPEATLLRYEVMADVLDKIKNPILIYLDSDMIVQPEFLTSLEPMTWQNGVAVVCHPGFYRAKGFVGLRERIKNPFLLTQDVRFLFRVGVGMGTWETRRNSRAFVPRANRKTYVHGAIWMGENGAFKEMVCVLAENVQVDLQNGLIAIWHDESHLNWYCSNNIISILDSRFSWYPEYKHLRHFSPLIRSMNKPEMNFERVVDLDADN